MRERAVLRLKQDIYTLQAGDSVNIPSYMKHKCENPFDQDAIILFAVTPPSF